MALPELSVRTVLDVVTENFERVELKAFACRIVYAGGHFLEKQELIRVFKETVQAANSCYCDIHLTGLLLVYEAFFVHILEGSEDTINRQLRFLLKKALDYDSTPPPPPPPPPPADPDEDEEDKEQEEVQVVPEEVVPERKMFNRLKLLLVYHSIEHPTITGWGAITAKPPTLVTKLDMYGNMAAHFEQLRLCLDKINKLCAMYNDDHKLSFEGVSAADPKMEALPEFLLLELLLDSVHVIDLKTYYGYHRRVDDYTFYFELVWPLPTHYTPRHLYKLKIDDSFVEPLPLQEWQKVPEGKEEEEKEEGASSKSSSD